MRGVLNAKPNAKPAVSQFSAAYAAGETRGRFSRSQLMI